MSPGPVYALLAGLLAGGSSVFAKLTLGSHIVFLCEFYLSPWSVAQDGPIDCDWLHLSLRLLCGALLLACNTGMWFFFSKALRHSASSASAIVTTTGSNFICSGVLGEVLFGEAHDTQWWAGVFFITVGLLLLHRDAPQEKHKKE